jgi:indole-3-glycerol phosphate synthase
VAYRVIAEVKKASPSRGVIRADFDPVRIARAYAAGGAAALSVLTDEKHFQGKPEFLEAIRGEVDLPILRKDFLIDPYQVWESRALGADAILVILAAVDDALAASLAREARDLGMDVLWEVHDGEDLRRASAFAPALVGINNRALKTFAVTLETTRRLLPDVPRGAVAVSESGFSTRDELEAMASWGAGAFLIGESLMRAADPGEALRALVRREAAGP